ncbi:hypothetical protein OE88DRAFT_466214 [Heliocybe sulcata]|uniref:RING-type domain-containing protein n=1 Tax=Heliocybe sulcata TaxID=5364 RepID=A0A5C3MVV0_9AGAM|nr:hypothetical protein OE88DRAFT_466214 [Heliocybe sulcata]
MTEGMPLLSGPPPEMNDGDTSACRKCGKEFGLFTRSRRCNHCGYSYCHSCTDYQALMPRRERGAISGYDANPVCSYCIELLQITAAGRAKLRSLPLAKLKKYINAYNLKANGAVEKDDLIDVIISARGPDGCLPPEKEAYYRKRSLPTWFRTFQPFSPSTSNSARSFFSRTFGDSSHSHSRSSNPPPSSRPPPQRTRSRSHGDFPRPDLDPDYQRQQQQRPSAGASYRNSPSQDRPWNAYPGNASAHGRPQPSANTHGNPYPAYVPPPGQGRPQPPTATSMPRRDPPAPAPPPRPRSANEPIPTLDELLEMSEDQVARLSVHVLKDVLFHNHVPARQVLEKAELVHKVMALVDQEKRERERKREEERREEEAYQARQQALRDEMRAKQEREEREKREREHQGQEGHNEDGQTPGAEGKEEKPKPLTPQAQAMAASLERTGLCVICQDEEANIAVVDCGHLAMCRTCADHIMSSTRECPLCRTRIVTEARLLRIFKP